MVDLKIAFKYFPRERKEDNFFLNFLSKNYNIKIVPEYKADFLFFSTFNGKFPHKIPFVKFKGIKIFWTGENCRIDMNKTDFAFGFDYEEVINDENYLRLPLYVYYGAGTNLIKDKNFNAENILKDKKEFCDYVYSKDTKERVLFFKELSKYKKIFAPGKSLNNTSPIMPSNHKFLYNIINRFDFVFDINNKLSSLFSRHFSNWRQEVINYHKKFKFSIAFENSSYSGYTTEKIYHAMLANTIPIYWGNPDIKRDFNTKSFINYHDYNDFKKLVDIIIDLDQDNKKYLKKLKEPWLKDNKLNKWMNLKRIKKQFDKIFGLM